MFRAFKNTTIIGSALTLSLTTIAIAQDMAEQSKSDRLDIPSVTTEQSNVLSPTLVNTKDDARIFAEKEFLKADVNTDNAVNIEEFTDYLSALSTSIEPIIEASNTSATISVTRPTPDQIFAEISKGDNEISKDEMVESRTASFDAADKDGDSVLNETEKQSFAALVLAKKAS